MRFNEFAHVQLVNSHAKDETIKVYELERILFRLRIGGTSFLFQRDQFNLFR